MQTFTGEPNLREYTEEEIDEMMFRHTELWQQGRHEEAAKAIDGIPMIPRMAEAIKRMKGMQYLIDHQLNLSKAVKEYGKEWLYS